MAKASSRSAAAKKAWATRRKLYGKSGMSKSSSKKTSRVKLTNPRLKKMYKAPKRTKHKRNKYDVKSDREKAKSKVKSRGRMRIYSEGGGHVTVPR